MGFFKNLFKKKKGGTFFGNLLRKGASTVTGGILGSGAGLAAWEAKQEQKDIEAQMAANQNMLEKMAAQKAALNKAGKAVLTSDEAKPLTNLGAKAWLAKNWKWLLIPVAILAYMYKSKLSGNTRGLRRR